jgi:hypothetical protein
MRILLDLVTDLQKAGALDGFASCVDTAHWRTGAAILTIEKDFGTAWNGDVAKLNDDDRAAVLERVPPNTYTPPAKPDASGDDGSPLTIGVMFVPKNIHRPVAGQGGSSADPPAAQIQGQYEIAAKKAGRFKFSWSAVVQATLFYDEAKKQFVGQPMVGGQGTIDTFITPIIHYQVFVQMLDGATLIKGKSVNGSASFQALATQQLAAGVQAVYNLGGKHLQLVLQAQVSSTQSKGSVTVDASTGIGLQWAF